MPNWCKNKLTITGSADHLQKFDTAFKGYQAAWKNLKPKGKDYCLNALYPVPKEIIEIGFTLDDSDDKAKELYQLHKKDGYDWCIENWSVKWDCDIELFLAFENSYEYRFLSPWNSPFNWALEVSKKWPNIQIALTFYEPGVVCAGESVYKNGEIIQEIEHIHAECEYEAFVHENFGSVNW